MPCARYYTSYRCTEIDCDVAASFSYIPAISTIIGLLQQFATSLAIDVAFAVEPQVRCVPAVCACGVRWICLFAAHACAWCCMLRWPRVPDCGRAPRGTTCGCAAALHRPRQVWGGTLSVRGAAPFSHGASPFSLTHTHTPLPLSWLWIPFHSRMCGLWPTISIGHERASTLVLLHLCTLSDLQVPLAPVAAPPS